MKTEKAENLKESKLKQRTGLRKFPKIIFAVMLLAAALGFLFGQSIASHYTIRTYTTFVIVEEPLVVKTEPSNGQIQLSTGENLTIKFSISSKSDQVQYKAVIICFVSTSGYLSSDNVNITWEGIDGYTTIEGDNTPYPWVLVPKTTNRGQPGPPTKVNCTISIPEDAPSGTAIVNFLIKRKEA